MNGGGSDIIKSMAFLAGTGGVKNATLASQVIVIN